MQSMYSAAPTAWAMYIYTDLLAHNLDITILIYECHSLNKVNFTFGVGNREHCLNWAFFNRIMSLNTVYRLFFTAASETFSYEREFVGSHFLDCVLGLGSSGESMIYSFVNIFYKNMFLTILHTFFCKCAMVCISHPAKTWWKTFSQTWSSLFDIFYFE